MPKVRIGNAEIEKTAVLAPMAGVADSALRMLCREFGAAWVTSEMVSAKGMTFGDRKSAGLMELDPRERPASIQLFGDCPETLARAAEMALRYEPDMLDINMGCPAPKIAGNGGGCALMKQPALAGRIIEAVVRVSPVPVTVKFRKGWDNGSVNAVEFAKMCEQSGAAAVTVHGRTRAQMYSPPADWDIIRQVKRAVGIPVIGNGDVVDAQGAKEMYERTGCDLVMVGRGALGSPWVFEEIARYLSTGEISPPPAVERRMEIMLRQAELAVGFKGEYAAMREMRKHCGWYMKGLRGAAGLRRAAGTLETLDDARELARAAVVLHL